jgi:glyoxylase-like metal-dependent hydrolase (beta-lactamase superfamily II)
MIHDARAAARAPGPLATVRAGHGRLGTMASTLLRLSEILPGVWVAHSRRYRTTSTVVLDGHGGALVVDPAWDADELAAIPADLATLGVRCVAGLSTHMHYDHVLWHPDLGDVPRWSTAGTVRATVERREEVLRPLVGDIPDDLVEIAARLTPIEGELLEWSGPTALVHVHHAHAPHHLALELPDLGLLIAGDMLSDVELPMPDGRDADLVTYRTGLESLEDVVRRCRVLVPGHGAVSERPIERWDADRRYLDDVEERGVSDDPRIALPDMPELHAANLELARGSR